MASLWNKTLFYLGLVDEEEQGPDYVEPTVGEVRPIEPTPQRPTPPPSAPFPEQQQAPPPPPATASVRPPGQLAGRRVEPPAATRRSVSSDPTHAEAGLYVHPTSDQAQQSAARRSDPESQIIVARNFSDAQSLADSIRAGRSVVLDLRSTEPEMVRRIVDFASGLTYALDGKMSKTAQGVILVTPAGVSLGLNEQERLARLGLFGDDR